MSEEQIHILVVDDDKRLRDLIGRYLTEQGYRVTTAVDAADARAKLAGITFDLLVVDIMMPGENGLDLTRSLREKTLVPILLLTAMGEANDRINGLETGADDYLVKPFDLPELEARVRALLRRQRPSLSGRLHLGELMIDISGRSVYHGSQRIDLSAREFGVLELLARRAGRVVSKEQLLESLTGWYDDVGTNAIEVYVHRLRKKLEPGGINIRTIRGLGYLLDNATRND